MTTGLRSLEHLSDEALKRFAEFGAYLDDGGAQPIPDVLDNGSTAAGPASVQQYLFQRDNAKVAAWTGNPDSLASWSPFKVSALGKALSWAGGAFDAVTGICGMARQFHQDVAHRDA